MRIIQIWKVCLYSNPIASEDCAQQLFESISNHASLKYVIIGDATNNGNVLKLLNHCSENIERIELIELIGNSINSTDGNSLVPNFSSRYPSLELFDLSVSEYNFDNNNAAQFVKSLKRNNNRSIKCLGLGQNSLTEAGWYEFEKAVFNSASLNAAADSNNSC